MAVGRRSEVPAGARARRSEPWPEHSLRQDIAQKGRSLARAGALCSSPRRRTYSGCERGCGAVVVARRPKTPTVTRAWVPWQERTPQKGRSSARARALHSSPLRRTSSGCVIGCGAAAPVQEARVTPPPPRPAHPRFEGSAHARWRRHASTRRNGGANSADALWRATRDSNPVGGGSPGPQRAGRASQVGLLRLFPGWGPCPPPLWTPPTSRSEARAAAAGP